MRDASAISARFWVPWRVSDCQTLTLLRKGWHATSVPSHALPSGQETRIRRQGRRREARRRLRDWNTWGVFLEVLVGLWLSGGIVGHLWPKAHGVGYVVTHVVVRVVLGGAIGAVLAVVVVMLAGVVRGRRLRP
jgi:hypothetical protein